MTDQGTKVRENLQGKPAREFAESERGGNPNRRWVVASLATLLLSVVIAGGILGYRWVQRLTSPPTLGLNVTRETKQFLVNWDRKAPEILRARRGVLTIRDGSYEDHLELDPLTLRRGSITYASVGADIQFRLFVFWDRDHSLSESVHALTPKDTTRPETGKTSALAGVNTGGTPERGLPAAGHGKSEASATKVVSAALAKQAVVKKNSPVIPKATAASARIYRAQRMAQPPARTSELADVKKAPRTLEGGQAAVPVTYLGPQVIHRVELVIPAESRASLAPEAQIDIRVSIDTEGAVTDAKVTSGSGAHDPSLVSAAVRVARQFRFQPARWKDDSVPSAMILSFRFVR